MREIVLIKLFAPLQFLCILFSVCWCRKQFLTVKVACPSYTPVHSALCFSFSSVCISIVLVLGPIKRHKGANPDLVMLKILLPNLQACWHCLASRTVTIFFTVFRQNSQHLLVETEVGRSSTTLFLKAVSTNVCLLSPPPSSMPGTQLW